LIDDLMVLLRGRSFTADEADALIGAIRYRTRPFPEAAMGGGETD